MQAKLAQIAKIVDAENLFTDHASRLACARTANPLSITAPLPLALARPRHSGQIAALLKFCSSEGINITFRGGGTAVCGNAAPTDQDTLIILTTGLDRILDIDVPNRVAFVQPGVTCARLDAAAREHGFFYPPQPYVPDVATIGGGIAMNAAGAKAAKYGPAANFVLALDIFTANGEKMHCKTANALPGSPTQGLPLANLFCGSMGSIAFIGDSVLRLEPLPQCVRTRIFQFGENAADAAAAIMGAGLVPAELELYDPICGAILLGNPESKVWLLEVSFAGDAVETEDNMTKAADICGGFAGVEEDCSISAFYKARAGLLTVLAARGDFRYRTFSCPPSRLPMLAGGIKDICSRMDQKAAIFGHAAIAAIHVAFLESGQDAELASREIFTLSLMLNDAMTSEKDAELTHRQWQARGAAITDASMKLRPIFDPAGILAHNALPGAALS